MTTYYKIDCLCDAAMQHIFAMANHVTALLNGATDPDPSQHGMTTEEERASSSKPQVSCMHLLWHGPSARVTVTSTLLQKHQERPASSTSAYVSLAKSVAQPNTDHCKECNVIIWF